MSSQNNFNPGEGRQNNPDSTNKVPVDETHSRILYPFYHGLTMNPDGDVVVEGSPPESSEANLPQATSRLTISSEGQSATSSASTGDVSVDPQLAGTPQTMVPSASVEAPPTTVAQPSALSAPALSGVAKSKWASDKMYIDSENTTSKSTIDASNLKRSASEVGSWTVPVAKRSYPTIKLEIPDGLGIGHLFGKAPKPKPKPVLPKPSTRAGISKSIHQVEATIQEAMKALKDFKAKNATAQSVVAQQSQSADEAKVHLLSIAYGRLKQGLAKREMLYESVKDCLTIMDHLRKTGIMSLYEIGCARNLFTQLLSNAEKQNEPAFHQTSRLLERCFDKIPVAPMPVASPGSGGGTTLEYRIDAFCKMVREFLNRSIDSSAGDSLKAALDQADTFHLRLREAIQAQLSLRDANRAHILDAFRAADVAGLLQKEKVNDSVTSFLLDIVVKKLISDIEQSISSLSQYCKDPATYAKSVPKLIKLLRDLVEMKVWRSLRPNQLFEPNDHL